jgi:hypothetical protein
MQKRPKLLHLFAFMMLLTLACGPCSLLSADLPTPPHPIAVSTESAAQLESRIQQNLGGAPGQPFIMRMTDAEVTSLVAAKLSQYGDSPVADPQIWFTKGKIYGTGRLVNVLPIETKFFVVASARIEDGQVEVDIEESSAGALPIPSRMLDTISQSINETMNDLQLDVKVDALEILEGEAIIKGTRE